MTYKEAMDWNIVTKLIMSCVGLIGVQMAMTGRGDSFIMLVFVTSMLRFGFDPMFDLNRHFIIIGRMHRHQHRGEKARLLVSFVLTTTCTFAHHYIFISFAILILQGFYFPDLDNSALTGYAFLAPASIALTRVMMDWVKSHSVQGWRADTKAVVHLLQNETTLTNFVNGRKTWFLTVIEYTYWLPGTSLWVIFGALTMEKPFDIGFYELLLGLLDVVTFSLPILLDTHSIVRKIKAEARDNVYILGYGSFLSPASARSSGLTSTPLTVMLPGHRRVFDHPEVHFVNSGISDLASNEIACLTAEPSKNPADSVLCHAFKITAGSVIGQIAKLEHTYRWTKVIVTTSDFGEPITAFMATTGTEAACKQRISCTEYSAFLSAGYLGIWMYEASSNILPCRTYLHHCLSSACALGTDSLDNFLNSTYLIDRKTAIGEYLMENPLALTANLLGTSSLDENEYRVLTPGDVDKINLLLKAEWRIGKSARRRSFVSTATVSTSDDDDAAAVETKLEVS